MAAALIITVVLGLLSRRWTTGVFVWDKVVGDALYAVAVYLVVVLVSTALRRAWTAPVIAGIAAGICWAIEAFQATGWAARSVSSANIRAVLGTTFGFTDLIWYVIGVAAIALIDVVLLRPGVAYRTDPDSPGPRSDW